MLARLATGRDAGRWFTNSLTSSGASPPQRGALSADLERVSSSMSNEGTIISIQLLSNDSSLGDAQIRVSEGQIARDAIQAAYATLTADQMKRLVVCLAGDEIDMESSFEANGIEDGARLEVCLMLCPCLCIWHCC